MITGTKPPHICFLSSISIRYIKVSSKEPHSLLHQSSPGPPHLQHAQLGAMGCRALSVISHMGRGPFFLEVPGSDRLPWESYTHPLVSKRKEILLELGLGGAITCRLGQRLQQVVEETGAQGLVHPFTSEKHVVHLMHALDVACAVLLLSLQPQCEFCRESWRCFDIASPAGHFASFQTGLKHLSEVDENKTKKKHI